MVELVVIIIVIGIVALLAVPRWNANSGFDERTFRDRLVSGLRYAQKAAVAARRTTCATFSNAPASVSFRISTANGAANCAVGTVLNDPEGEALVVTAPANTMFSSLPADVVFDAAGRPGAAATISVVGLAPALNIQVEVETGYVR